MPTIDENYILIPGPGVMLYQAYTTNTSDQFKKMRTFGATSGITITTTRETLDYEEGTPLAAVVRDVIRETGTVEITVAEKDLEAMLGELGLDVTGVTEEAATTGNTDTFTLWLRAYGWQLVPGIRYSMMNSVTVTSTDATPVTYVENTDYAVGEVEGNLAIRRLSGGSIDDREEVEVEVNYDTPSRRVMKVGGRNSIEYVHLMHIKAFRDGTRREITQIYKASTAGEVVEEFPKDAHAERTVRFGMLQDTTRTAGDRLWRKYQENTT